MRRLLSLFASAIALFWSLPALASVTMTFHSFNGSVLFGRYPHTFVSLDGTLDANGQKVHENYGFTAKSVSPAILSGPVEHKVVSEPEKYILGTNHHFSIKMTDAQYWQVVAEMKAWRDAPGKYYSLDNRNCIHFVGKIAEIMGLKVDFPQKLLRKPKQWLNHITALNPQMHAKQVK